MKKLLLSLLFIIFFNSSVWAAPQVVVSIKPLHSLVAGVMQGVGAPELLIKGGGTPHGYQLRPSEARALANADLIIWVGEALESFLEKPLRTLARQARQLELAAALDRQLLPAREGGSWNGHAGHQHDHAGHAGKNPHFWLDPRLGKQVVEVVTGALSELDPENQPGYQKNAAALTARLDQLHQQLTAKLAPVKEAPYIVFHDAYQYFEAAYDLRAVGSISVDPERKPGARRIAEIRQKIIDLQASCVFSEPQFEPRLVATIIEGTGARSGILDPLGAELPAGPESYFLLLDRLAASLKDGLR